MKNKPIPFLLFFLKQRLLLAFSIKGNCIDSRVIATLILAIALAPTQASATYDYKVLAEIGTDTDGGGGALTGILPTVSINDDGMVAFVGNTAAGGSIFVTDGTKPPKNISFSSPSSTRVYALGAQINNANKVVARDRSGGDSFIRIWDAKEPNVNKIIAKGSLSTAQFDSVFSHATINNEGSAAFSALTRHTSFLVDPDKFGLTCSNECLVSSPETWRNWAPRLVPAFSVQAIVKAPVRPMLSDNGKIVLRVGNLPTDPIRLVGNSLQLVGSPAPFEDIASSTYFSETGMSPGVSDDGQIVVFYGDLTGVGAAKLNSMHTGIRAYDGDYLIELPTLTEGAGIFASIEIVDSTGFTGRVMVPIAGSDVFDSFSKDIRVAVNSTQSKNYAVTVVFRATKGGIEGIYTNQLVFSSFPDKLSFDPRKPKAITPGTPIPVLQMGDTIEALYGDPISDIQLYDPINNSGDGGVIAMWVSTAGGNQAVILAKPKIPDVVAILTHGFNPSPKDWSGFRNNWIMLGEEVKKIPDEGNPYKGKISTYISEWESTEYFLEGFGFLFLSKVLKAYSNYFYSKSFLPLDSYHLDALNFESFSLLSYLSAKTVSLMSKRLAEDAANKIYNDVVRDWLPSGPCLGSGACNPDEKEKIFVVGHSRGAAVNARITKKLVDNGYNVVHVVVLDGFSTDWPDDAGKVLGDINIQEETSIQSKFGLTGARKVNYTVQKDLSDWIIDDMLFPSEARIVPANSKEMYKMLACKLVPDGYLGCDSAGDIIRPETPPEVITFLRDLNLRAPNRSATSGNDLKFFEDKIFDASNATFKDGRCNDGLYKPNQSFHTNITSCYWQSAQQKLPESPPPFYIHDNFIKAGN